MVRAFLFRLSVTAHGLFDTRNFGYPHAVRIMMRAHARERIPSATAAYLEAYAALEVSAREAQTLVDRLITIMVALTDTGIRLRGDAWKFALINELPSLRDAAGDGGRSIRLTDMPKAAQMLEAIGEWRKKRKYLQQLWDHLPAEVRVTLKVPDTLD
jgi:hypothetical protein